MTTPHVHSDDLAISAAQARIWDDRTWDDLTARTRSMFERVCRDPNVYSFEAVGRLLAKMRQHHFARLSLEMMQPMRPAPINPHVNPVPLTVHVSNPGLYYPQQDKSKPHDPAHEQGDLA